LKEGFRKALLHWMRQVRVGEDTTAKQNSKEKLVEMRDLLTKAFGASDLWKKVPLWLALCTEDTLTLPIAPAAAIDSQSCLELMRLPHSFSPWTQTSQMEPRTVAIHLNSWKADPKIATASWRVKMGQLSRLNLLSEASESIVVAEENTLGA
jgi:hypothetical protein